MTHLSHGQLGVQSIDEVTPRVPGEIVGMFVTPRVFGDIVVMFVTPRVPAGHRGNV